MKTDLFGNRTGGYIARDASVHIAGNETLANACNRLIKMVREDESLIAADSIKEVDARIFAELAWQDRFAKLIAPERKEVFIQAMLGLPDAELFSRARRELVSRDIIRLSAKAIRSAEQHRARISDAMR